MTRNAILAARSQALLQQIAFLFYSWILRQDRRTVVGDTRPGKVDDNRIETKSLEERN